MINQGKKGMSGITIVIFLLLFSFWLYGIVLIYEFLTYKELLTGEVEQDSEQQQWNRRSLFNYQQKPRLVINQELLNQQVGNLQKNARQYYEYRDQYDDSIPECKATYYGLEWLRYMNDTLVEVCQPQNSKQDNIRDQNRIKCTLIHDRFPETYCLAENIAVDIPTTIQHYQSLTDKKLSPEEQQDKFPPFSSLKSTCKISSALWKREYFWDASEKWLQEALSSGRSYSMEEECVAWVDQPVYVLGRYIGEGNLFWALNTAAEAFLAYALFNIDHDAQLIVLDQVSDESLEKYFGLGLEIFASMFSPRRPIRTLNGILQEAIQKSGKTKGSVCFRKMMFNTLAYRSFLAKNNRLRTRCRNSAAVNGLVDMLTDALDITEVHPKSLFNDKAKLQVIWPSRQGFSRNIENEDEVIQFLDEKVTALGHSFQSVHLEKIDLVSQMRFVRSADVLVGLHGAALTHAFVMPQTSALIELELEHRGEAYRNTGIWRNLYYTKYYHGSLKPNKTFIADMVIESLKQVDQRISLMVLPDGTLGPEFRNGVCGAEFYEQTKTYYQLDCEDP
eukprot:TRINITY_DN1146_c0_g1_i8.p1 TRINITY_DN1146_c0_g1~~TRINITY_DN1146_c0_g1_i8.p1  ORF type:complete len:561 (+),score=40.83 TRINITY_DN1146_c0_g1_i8:80-1762(+)